MLAQDLWIGVGETHEGRTVPNDPVMFIELDNYPLPEFLNTEVVNRA
ncbi:hypothetical protein RM550_09270 [Streptomyces sp. DSM 41527]|uniref:Uncharacterized protein n=1 Tax=Streptomyces mooreae TaxID=3075523 RepID=A0ABU2T3X5_9ACTN|nr:hypothetical protein [Streptomyces sp. DSM 41527]MDT0455927.1 hypothetical protein [Streptomyces sp. DSM 41527]